MEGYAIAWACRKAGVEFICHKYVSDKADAKAAESFGDNIHKGQDYYERLIKQYAING
jgi:nucleoside phosphorylase